MRAARIRKRTELSRIEQCRAIEAAISARRLDLIKYILIHCDSHG
jgi:hypothetical protein